MPLMIPSKPPRSGATATTASSSGRPVSGSNSNNNNNKNSSVAVAVAVSTPSKNNNSNNNTSSSASVNAGSSLLRLGMRNNVELRAQQQTNSWRGDENEGSGALSTTLCLSPSAKTTAAAAAAAPLSFGWASTLTSVYGVSSDAVLDVLSSIDAAVRGTFNSARDHYVAVCGALEIAGKPNRTVMACCDAHDKLHELVMQWATENAVENNIEKFTRVSEEEHEEQEEEEEKLQQGDEKQKDDRRVAVLSSISSSTSSNDPSRRKFDTVAWHCDSAANMQLTAQDAHTEHRHRHSHKRDNRRLQEQVKQSHRALLEAALKAGAADFKEDDDNSAQQQQSQSKTKRATTTTTTATARQILLLWNDPVLSVLDTSKTVLGERGTAALFATLQMLPHLTSLSFANAKLLSPFVAALGVLCRPRFLPRLRSLDLSGNFGGSLAVEALTELVRSHPLLTSISIDGFEALPAATLHLSAALRENADRNGRRLAHAQEIIGAEQAERDSAAAKKIADALSHAQSRLSLLVDLEGKARAAVRQIEDAEFGSEMLASSERARLSLKSYLSACREQRELRIKTAKEEELWVERRKAERLSVEERERLRRKNDVEAELERVFAALRRDEVIKREAILRNAALQASLSEEMRQSRPAVEAKKGALAAAREEFAAAKEARLELDREVALKRRRAADQAIIDTEAREARVRSATVECDEVAGRALIGTMFARELELWRKFAADAAERVRVAAMELTRRKRDEEIAKMERAERDKRVYAEAQEELRLAQERLVAQRKREAEAVARQQEAEAKVQALPPPPQQNQNQQVPALSPPSLPLPRSAALDQYVAMADETPTTEQLPPVPNNSLAGATLLEAVADNNNNNNLVIQQQQTVEKQPNANAASEDGAVKPGAADAETALVLKASVSATVAEAAQQPPQSETASDRKPEQQPNEAQDEAPPALASNAIATEAAAAAAAADDGDATATAAANDEEIQRRKSLQSDGAGVAIAPVVAAAVPEEDAAAKLMPTVPRRGSIASTASPATERRGSLAAATNGSASAAAAAASHAVPAPAAATAAANKSETAASTNADEAASAVQNEEGARRRSVVDSSSAAAAGSADPTATPPKAAPLTAVAAGAANEREGEQGEEELSTPPQQPPQILAAAAAAATTTTTIVAVAANSTPAVPVAVAVSASVSDPASAHAAQLPPPSITAATAASKVDEKLSTPPQQPLPAFPAAAAAAPSVAATVEVKAEPSAAVATATTAGATAAAAAAAAAKVSDASLSAGIDAPHAESFNESTSTSLDSDDIRQGGSDDEL